MDTTARLASLGISGAEVGSSARAGDDSTTGKDPVALSPVPVPPKVGVRVSLPLAERVTGISLSYDQIVDALLLSPPGETQGALAKRLGFSQSWLSRLIASDSFQTRLAERLEKDIEPGRREVLRMRFASIEEEARGILKSSLEKLAARLEDPAGVPDQLLVKSVEVTGRLLGYGARNDPPQAPVNLHVHLENLADNLRKLNGAPRVTIDQAPAPAGGGPHDR